MKTMAKIQVPLWLILGVLCCPNLSRGSEGTLSSLEEREKKIQEREQALKEQLARHEKNMEELKIAFQKDKNTHEERLKSQEETWKKKVHEMEKELKAKTEELDGFKERQLASFLAVYEKMEPKQAAKVLETTDVKLATQIITQMKAQRAAEVLAKMSAERARLITEAGFTKKTKKISQKVNEAPENSPIAPIGDAE